MVLSYTQSHVGRAVGFNPAATVRRSRSLASVPARGWRDYGFSLARAVDEHTLIVSLDSEVMSVTSERIRSTVCMTFSCGFH